MKTSDFIAILALVLSAAALALEVRRWVETRPRMRLYLIPDAVELPGDGKPKLALWVTNIGTTQMLITGFFVFAYSSRLHRLFRRTSFSAVVNPAVNRAFPEIPAMLTANERWVGMLQYEENTIDARQRGQLYVGVTVSHRRRPKLVRVPPSTKTGEQP